MPSESSLRSTVRAFALIAAAILLTVPVSAQERGGGAPNHGRIAGIAVSVSAVNPAGDGRDVDFDVEMTTTRLTWLETQTGTEVRGNGVALTNTSNTGSGTAGLGDLDLYFRYHGSGSQQFSSENFSNRTTGGNSTWYTNVNGTLLERTWITSSYEEAELPGIDYGDGVTVQATALPTLVDRTTETLFVRGDIRLRVVSKWRGTFSHSYPDLTEVQMRVASRCCPRDDRPERGYSTIYTGHIETAQSPSQLQFWYQSTSLTAFQNATTTFSSGNRGFTTPATGTFSRTWAESGTLTSEDQRSQLVNTATLLAGGGANVLEIPTVGTVGLALLSGLLLLVGVGILRR